MMETRDGSLIFSGPYVVHEILPDTFHENKEGDLSKDNNSSKYICP